MQEANAHRRGSGEMMIANGHAQTHRNSAGSSSNGNGGGSKRTSAAEIQRRPSRLMRSAKNNLNLNLFLEFKKIKMEGLKFVNINKK